MNTTTRLYFASVCTWATCYDPECEYREFIAIASSFEEAIEKLSRHADWREAVEEAKKDLREGETLPDRIRIEELNVVNGIVMIR